MKLPATKDPLAKDIEEIETQQANMMKLIMEQSAQLKKMETDMEKIIKEKEQASKMAVVPLEALPITTIPTTTSSTTSIGEGSDYLENVIQNMSLQTK